MKSKFLSKKHILNFASIYVFFLMNNAVNATAEVKNPLPDIFSLSSLLNRFTSFLIPTAIIGFVLCVAYATYVRLFSSGDSAKEKQSFAIARNAAIGFFAIFMSGIVIQILSGFLKLNV